MFEIEKAGKEKYAKQIATFRSKNKVRVIRWSPIRGEIYLGHEDGIITIWNAKQGQSICIWVYLFQMHCKHTPKQSPN